MKTEQGKRVLLLCEVAFVIPAEHTDDPNTVELSIVNGGIYGEEADCCTIFADPSKLIETGPLSTNWPEGYHVVTRDELLDLVRYADAMAGEVEGVKHDNAVQAALDTWLERRKGGNA